MTAQAVMDRETPELKEELFEVVEVAPGGIVRVLYAGEFHSSHQTMDAAQKRIRLVLKENKGQCNREIKMKERGLVGKEGSPRLCEHNVPIDRFECRLCNRAGEWPRSGIILGRDMRPEADWSKCDHNKAFKDCEICYPMETLTITRECTLKRPGCLGKVEVTTTQPRGTQLSSEFHCKNCAGKLDKRGRLRKPRPRKSLSMDNPSYRIDKYRAARKPAGMTETKFRGTIETAVVRNREEVLWLEQNLLSILAAEGIVTSPSDLELLKLYQAGKSHQEIASTLGFSKANVGVVLKRISPQIRRRIRNSSRLCQLVSPVFRDGDNDDPIRTTRQIEGSELASETYVPLKGQKPQFPHGRPALLPGAQSFDPIDSVAALDAEDLDSEGLDYEFGMDREEPIGERG